MANSLAQLASLADSQGGCVTKQQAICLGVTVDRVRADLAATRWAMAHPGVYVTFTGTRPYETRCWAAVLAAGPGAVVTGASAMRLFGVASARGGSETIHVAIDHARRVAPSLSGVAVHRRRGLAAVTHPTRRPPSVRIEEAAIQHAARCVRPSVQVGALADVCQLRLTTPERLSVALAAMPRLPGRRVLQQVLDDVATGAQSFLEIGFLRWVERAHGLPAAERQVRAAAAGRLV